MTWLVLAWLGTGPLILALMLTSVARQAWRGRGRADP